ncbi:BQ2448_6652 [Microbotryum intermedium]|uniref:BQ2448_6652 protein n=1 Tax=Microbotryum intermedium TaxID=269621 RepID=A0A238FK98_9BASI|nr:BQ2448_6652 [Microbotryum intermedium]
MRSNFRPQSRSQRDQFPTSHQAHPGKNLTDTTKRSGSIILAAGAFLLSAVSAAPVVISLPTDGSACNPDQFYDPAIKTCTDCTARFPNATRCNRGRPTACSFGRVRNNQCLARTSYSGPRYLTADGASCRCCPDTNEARCGQSSGVSVACNYVYPTTRYSPAATCTGEPYLAPSAAFFCLVSCALLDLLRTDPRASTHRPPMPSYCCRIYRHAILAILL